MTNEDSSSSPPPSGHNYKGTLAQRWRLERRRRRELDVLYRLSTRLAESNRMEAMAAAIVKTTLEAVGGTFAALVLQDGQGAGVCWALVGHRRLEEEFPLRVGEPVPASVWSVFRQALRRSAPWVLSCDPEEDSVLSEEEGQALQALGVRLLGLVPVRLRQVDLGVLVLGEQRCPARSTWDVERRRWLMTIARLSANALYRARLHRELAQAYAASRERAERMEQLVRIGLALNRTLTVEEVGETIGRSALALSRAQRAVVYLRRDEPPYAHPLWSQGFSPKYFDLVREHEDDLPVRRLLEQPEVILIDDVYAQEQYPFYHKLARVGGYRALGVFPMVRGGRSIGAVTVYFTRPHAWTDDEVETLMIFASQAAEALENARLYHALEEAYLEAALALAKAMDARDSYTGDHSERLVLWAEAVARELGCSEEEIEALRWAARLHDIGKIGVPDAILHKKGPLTEEEWAVMRRHPIIGAEIVGQIKKLAPAAAIVRHHHERYDGQGYPDGLKGEAIPLGARILAVVDAYGAIVDRRPYKDARPHEEAVAELRRGAGTQFDPRVVEAFLRVLERSGNGLVSAQ